MLARVRPWHQSRLESTTMTTTPATPTTPHASRGSFLDRRHTIAPLGYNRWLIPPAALAVHLCIGQAYATSVYKTSLVAHFETSQTAIGVFFSIAIVMLGLSAAVMGKWVDRNGPRKAMFVAMLCWVAGFLIGALGIATGQLWLLYLGYGFVGGIGLGIGYISPVSTLIKWFPDRPGLATGLAIMGFGGGAMVASPLSRQLMSLYDPAYDPARSDTVASGSALTMLFLTLAGIYLLVMMLGVVNVRLPHPDWKPEGWTPPAANEKAMITTASVSAANAIRTPQFWLLWIVLFTNVTAGIGILEQASPMIQDFFRDGTGVSIVGVSAAAGFVGLLSLFNMAGRFAWSSASDRIGRKPIYLVYLGVGIVLVLGLALLGHTAVALFVLLAAVAISFYGGGFATVPAYLRDLFGTFQVGAIHGRLLTAWSAAGVVGPLIINGFLDAQGKPGQLTAESYQPALLTMVGVLAIGFVANLLVRRVHERHHEPEERVLAAKERDKALAAVSESNEANEHQRKPGALAVALSWLVVGGILAYGVTMTLLTAVKLFAG